jgi:hypothetical protein
MTWNYGYPYLGAEPLPGRTASSYREHRGPVVRQPAAQLSHRHHYHDTPPWPHRRYGDYAYFEGWGWWPRWFPYWDRRWHDYYWYLYDYYGGDAYPDYATYMADAVFRQYGPQWGLVISGAWTGAAQQGTALVHRGGMPTQHPGGGLVPSRGPVQIQPSGYDDRYRRRYPHPHDYYGDYIVVDNAWWPQWFPYWDPNWNRYWWQLYYAYGGDAYADYAQYARDAYLRSLAAQWGWI